MGRVIRPTILVVDDDPNVRHIAAQILTCEGYLVIEAAGASEAIDFLSVHEVDALVTDIRMPGLSGFMLAQQAKQLHPHIAVLYTTGFIPKTEWEKRRDEYVLQKPYRAPELVCELERALSHFETVEASIARSGVPTKR